MKFLEAVHPAPWRAIISFLTPRVRAEVRLDRRISKVWKNYHAVWREGRSLNQEMDCSAM